MLVGWAWRLYLANWRPVLAVSAILAVVEWLFFLATIGTLPAHPTRTQLVSVGVPFDLAGPLLVLIGVWAAATLLNFFGGAAEEGVAASGDMWACARASLSRAWPLLLTMLAATLAGAVGLALLVVPGVYLLTRWSVAPVLAAAEGQRAGAALRRSYELTAGHFWHALGTVLLVAVAIVAGTLALSEVGTVVLVAAGLRSPAGILLWQELVSAAGNPWLLATLVALRDDLVLRARVG